MQLSEVEDKPLERPEIEQPQGHGLVEKTIEEMRAERNLSLLFGYDGEGFEGDLDKALSVYKWARSKTESDTDALALLKSTIKLNGFSDTKKSLLNRMYLWISLQDNIEGLVKEQRILENESESHG